MKKLKIAQVTPYYHPSIGGVAGVAKYISEELVKRGHEVDVITAHRDHKERPKLNAPKKEIINGLNVYRYSSILNIGHMSYMPGLIPHFIKHKYDVIHYHSYRHPLCDVSAFFGKLKHSINILHGHGPFFEPGEISKKRQILYSIYDVIAKNTVLKWSNKIIALNNYEKKRYIEIGIPADKILVVPNAADNENFIHLDPRPFIDKYKLHDKKIILFVGIINQAKRPDLLIRALEKVVKIIPDAHLLIVGPDGGMLSKVKELGKALNLENHFTCTGPLYGMEKQQAYKSAKLFVLPSDLDAYPLVLMEALSHGLPVVTTDSRGPSDIIENGKTGFVVPKRNVEQIADRIIKLLSDEKLYNKMSQNARDTAIKKYKADSITQQIENIYFELLKK